MNKIFTLILFGAVIFNAHAQTVPPTQPYGKIDRADLELKSCDFEKDANAEVLFDKGNVYFTNYEIVFERHVRIKIFNDNGKNAADVRIPYISGDHFESIEKIQAETINQNDGKIEITKVDKKQMFDKRIDKERSSVTLTFPDVKQGSVIEYKYTIESPSAGDFPDWYFQSEFPTRYSEIEATVPDFLHYKMLQRISQPLVANTKDRNGEISKMAMANIPSINNEPYMSSIKDNLQCILIQLLSITSGGAMGRFYSESWNKIGENEAGYDDFGGEFKSKISGEDEIINHAKALKSDDQKISYIFNRIKNAMKWNDLYESYTDDGKGKAWDRKIGNSTEINLIVYHLLTRAGIKAYPILLSTKKHGKVNPAFPNRFQFNTSATYIPIDSANYYILDATGKYNVYNVIPKNLLNSFGLTIDKENKKYDVVFIQNISPIRDVVLVNAEIKPEGKMEGTAQIGSFSYNRIDNVNSYKTEGEKKYIDNLKDGNNDMKISSVKFDNMEVDSLPLNQNINFNLDLSGSDLTYIYFKPNLFTSMGSNPFLSEKRMTDIDFGYLNNYAIIGNYKIPTGFKTDALLKSVRMDMPDQSISFKRVVAEQEGTITVRYSIVYRKSILFKEDYGDIRDFYKKMYEFLNEQIILKKS
jgi:hypothetical protein